MLKEKNNIVVKPQNQQEKEKEKKKMDTCDATKTYYSKLLSYFIL